MAAFLVGSASVAEARELQTGLVDPLYESAYDGTNAVWLDRTTAAGAELVGLSVGWRFMAPTPPTPGVDPSSPADPRYDWTGLDASVRSIAARGLDVVLCITVAPDWAEAPGRPRSAPPGSWKPDPEAYGDFVTAVARRYSGDYADPLDPSASLPRVRYFRVWNEPNLAIHFGPQWTGREPSSPARYRALLNQAYDGVKGVDATNLILAPGLAPYGDPPGQRRMRPLRFLRELFCIDRSGSRQGNRCDDPARLDVLAHHPINAEAPRTPADHRDNATTVDLGKITSVVRAARRADTIAPDTKKPLWVTEFWWASRPPSSFGVSRATQARWLTEALYLFWRQSARVALWFQIADPAPTPDTVGSGLFDERGEPKPAERAFRFPFVADRRSRGTVLAWGIAPSAGQVLIEHRKRGGWRRVGAVRTEGREAFAKRVDVSPRGELRGRLAGEGVSAPWRID
jgi:hypothetical protein